MSDSDPEAEWREFEAARREFDTNHRQRHAARQAEALGVLPADLVVSLEQATLAVRSALKGAAEACLELATDRVEPLVRPTGARGRREVSAKDESRPPARAEGEGRR